MTATQTPPAPAPTGAPREGKSLFTPEILWPAIAASFKKLDPRVQVRNPVMFVTAAVAALMTVLLVIGHDGLTTDFKLQLVVWLWLTVLFGTFAEALAEGRGKAQAASLRATKAELTAKRLKGDGREHENVPASALKVGDIVIFDWNRNSSPDHTQIVSAIEPKDGGNVVKMVGHNLDNDYRDLDATITTEHPGAEVHFWSVA